MFEWVRCQARNADKGCKICEILKRHRACRNIAITKDEFLYGFMLIPRRVWRLKGTSLSRLLLIAAIAARLSLLAEQFPTTTSTTEHSENATGRRLFALNCSSCHGLDGSGTQRAPNIATDPDVRKLSRTRLFQVISGGVPGAGMPSFSKLGVAGIDAVTTYVRFLQGRSGAEHLPGNRQRGEAIFFGKGNCSNCHMARGRGGFVGPDLTAYGQAHSAEEIRGAITNPAKRNEQAMITATAMNGERYQGMVRNEDNFSIQLQSVDGVFHMLSKSALKSIVREPSIMPKDYSSRLSETELDDVINYLESLADTVPRTEIRRRGFD